MGQRLGSAMVFGQLLPGVALATCVTLWLVTDGALAAWGPWIFMGSLVGLGLPHGAVDHLVMARMADASVWSLRTLRLIGAYLCLVFVVLGAWLIAPSLVFVGFIGLTWFHWGQGDAWYVGVNLENGRAPWVSTVLSRGSLPMLVPLVFHREDYMRVAGEFIEAAGAVGPSLPTGAGLSWAAAVVVAVCVGAEYRVRGRGCFAELAMLLAFFAWVPPVLAIAVYFCLWHAPRHLVRLNHELAEGTWKGLGKVLVWSIPLTLAAIGLLGGLLTWIGFDDVFPVYLALIAALTVPHVIVVSWQDGLLPCLGRHVT